MSEHRGSGSPHRHRSVGQAGEGITRLESRRRIRYRVHTEGMVSSFNLGAFGIREGSERITVDGQVLEPGVDYSIDYELGLVTLSDPARVFGASPDAEIRANWEQKALFRLAPTDVFGMSARYRSDRGELNLVGMYQAERSLMARPQLGLEPGTSFVGGMSGRFDFGAAWLDHALDRVPGLRAGGVSSLRLDGELALSMPNPNSRGLTYLEDFEAGDEVPVGLERRLWRLGSRPDTRTGAGPCSRRCSTSPAPRPWYGSTTTGRPAAYRDRSCPAKSTASSPSPARSSPSPCCT
jgi:cell surface protein SprA